MERILICSDIHRFPENFWEALKRSAPIDRIFICGDLEERPEYFRAMAQDIPIVMVQGNCDHYLGSDLDPVIECDLEGRHILVTHGHLYNVGGGKPKALIRAAAQAGADLVFYGHSHKPLDEVWDGIHFINPGALRGTPDSCSFAILTLDKQKPEEKVEFFNLS